MQESDALCNQFNNMMRLDSQQDRICLVIRGPFHYNDNRSLNIYACGYNVYFYIYEGEKGTYVTCSEPDDGAYRFVTVEAGDYGDDFANAFVYFAYTRSHVKWYEAMLEDVQRRSHDIDAGASTIKFEEFWRWDEWIDEDLEDANYSCIMLYWWNGSKFEMHRYMKTSEGGAFEIPWNTHGARTYIYRYSPINGSIETFMDDFFEVTKRSRQRYLEFPRAFSTYY